MVRSHQRKTFVAWAYRLLLLSVLSRILETVHTAFCMQFVYDYIIVGFSDFRNFIHINSYVLQC